MQTEMKFEAKERRERKKKKGKKGKGEEKQDKSNYTTDIHLMDNATICSTYKTDLANGLTNAQVDQLQKQYGPNELTPPPTLAWYLKLLLSIFGGFFNQLLWQVPFYVLLLMVLLDPMNEIQLICIWVLS